MTKRDKMSPSSGKVYDTDDSVYDFTGWLKGIVTSFTSMLQKQDSTITALDTVGVANSADQRIDLPNALGQGTMAQSFKTVLASDHTDVPVIDTAHKRVHEGRYFSGGVYEPALGAGANIDLLIQVGASSIHAIFNAAAGADSIVQLFENATFSAAGTAVTISNHNRSSVKVFDGTVTHTPTLTATGTQINGTKYLPGGSGGNASGGEFNGFTNEFVLSPGKVYLLRLTNASNGNIKATTHFEGYLPTL